MTIRKIYDIPFKARVVKSYISVLFAENLFLTSNSKLEIEGSERYKYKKTILEINSVTVAVAGL